MYAPYRRHKSKLITMMKQRQVLLAKSKPTASQSERKPLVEPRRAKPKTKTAQ